MSKLQSIIRRILGAVAMLMAGFGLYYNFETASVAIVGGFEKMASEERLRYFYPVFNVMSAICVLCYLLLSWAGIRLVLGREFSLRIFTGLMIFEVLFVLCIGPLWLVPVIGSSIAASSGVAGGINGPIPDSFPALGSSFTVVDRAFAKECKPGRTRRSIQRWVRGRFEVGLPSPAWMN